MIAARPEAKLGALTPLGVLGPMQCPRCRAPAPSDALFCPACGAKLALVCAGCGATNATDHNFCKRCGAALAAEPPAPPLPGAGPVEAERRQLTVLFCDLVESTALAGRLDPEDLREVIRDYQEAAAGVVAQYDGYVAQYLGDGLLVYFGYPRAHEDDAQRAVRAGLGIVEAVRRLHDRPRWAGAGRLQARVGIHTGLVVVGQIGAGPRQEQLALGDTPNLAGRFQQLAEPDSVVIGPATQRLVQGHFAVRDLGLHPIKGLPAPLRLYQVLGDRPAGGPLDRVAGVTPFLDREEEMDLLLRRWRQVKEGLGQVVVLSGEAGIGKSRLVRSLRERIAGEPHTAFECRCSPYRVNSALHPLIDLVQRTFGLEHADTPAGRLARLQARLASFERLPQDTAALLASLLSLPLPEGERLPLVLTPERQKQKTLEALLTLLLELADRQPVVFVVEDLHWVDPSTSEFLTLLVDQAATAPLLLLFTCRPAFPLPWIARAHLTLVTLSRLSREHARRIVEQVAGKPLPAEVVQEVVTRTDGVPLFGEELTKMVLESGLLRERQGRYELAGPLRPLAIPATLHDSLMARLDRLGPVKALAQLGATIGRQFSYELLSAVASLDEAELQQALRQLVEAELLHQHGLPPRATYVFKHALIQDAAYQSLLKSARQDYHRRIARALTERFPEVAEHEPELLAHHLTEAGLGEQAVTAWLRAGRQASERSANAEAVAHLRRGLELLEALPETPDRMQRELELQIALGPALMAARSYAAPEVERAYARARQLCDRLGDPPQRFTVLRGLWGYAIVRADLATARDLGRECLALAERAGTPALHLWAHYALGMTLFHQGALPHAREHFERGRALYDPDRRRAPRALQDPGVACLSYLAVTLWLLGRPEQALAAGAEALTLAQKLAHPFSLAYALNIAAVVAQFNGAVAEVQERAAAAGALCAEHGIPYWSAWGRIFRGWALVEQGGGPAGLADEQEGLAAYLSTGARLVRPYFLGLVGEAHLRLGQVPEGLATVADALATAGATGEHWWDAELHRLRGRLLLAARAPDEPGAEACFARAREVAREQGARFLALRATLDLCRLWHRRGRRQDARPALAEACGGFGEAVTIPCLQEAEELLHELA